MLIDGKWVNSENGETITVINPANGEIVGTTPKCGEAEVEKAVAAAGQAFSAWAAKTVKERSKVLLKMSQLIMENQEELATLETKERGSPIRKTMNFDVPLCAEQLEFLAGASWDLSGETLPVGPFCMSMITREPLGVVGLITPWNFPALMVVWKMGAALVTGNTCVITPPSLAPLTALKLGEIAMEAGVPDGVVNVVTGPRRIVGEALVRHPKIAKIGLTGDTATNKRIMEVASNTVIQVGLELGGKNPFIIMPDADVDAAVEAAVFSAFFNTGQVCACPSRFYIHESLYDTVAEKLVAGASALRYGDTTDPATVIGPVAYKTHRDKIEAYIHGAKAAGAEILLGGERPNTPETVNGFFVAPTILGNCTNDMEVMQEEIYGPVVGLARFSSPEEAISLANDTRYGLCASVWTKDIRAGLTMAGQINAGNVWVNEHLMIFCETPLGGCKQSGFGKHLSTMAFDEYTATKHIYVDLIGQSEKPWPSLIK